MSSWTHIVATIDVDTFIQDKNIKERVESMLVKAPKITGSEEDADIFVNVLSGYNYRCPNGEYQTRIGITIVGNLRDRRKKRTWKEFVKFYRYLVKNCKFSIENRCVKIQGY